MYQNKQKWHVKWVIECKSMFQILEEKNRPACLYKSRIQRWREELGQVSISLQKESSVIFWSSISSSCSSLKRRVLCRMPGAWREWLQMAGKHHGRPAGSLSCPAPAPNPTPTPAPAGAPGLCFHPGTALCSHSSLNQLEERIFFPSIWCLSASFSLGRSDQLQIHHDFWVSCR